ncbi:hypothetical protein BA768_06355 [Chryseobacterium sp. CBo1]|nr:hypothetical protein BA768_06355 [Chryseobacterium sp. CBo1]
MPLQPGLSGALFATPFGRDKKASAEDINEMKAKALTEIYERSSKLPKKNFRNNNYPGSLIMDEKLFSLSMLLFFLSMQE